MCEAGPSEQGSLDERGSGVALVLAEATPWVWGDGESTGECWNVVSSASTGDGECQNCPSPPPGQLGRRGAEENGACQCFLPWRMFQQISAPLAHALKFVSESPSHLIPMLFKLLLLHWDLEGVKLCEPFKYSLFPAALLDVSSTGFQSQMLWGLCFLVQAPQLSPGWYLDPSFLKEGLCSCDIPPTCGSSCQGCGS